MICSNDMTAIGVLHALYRTTHRVPDDISVVGFDDIHLAQFMLPPLTTVQMSCSDLAAAAVEALRAGIEPDHPKACADVNGPFPRSWLCGSRRPFHAARCRRRWAAGARASAFTASNRGRVLCNLRGVAGV